MSSLTDALSNLNPITGIVNAVGGILTKYIPSEADRQKAMAEVTAEADHHQEKLLEIAAQDTDSARQMQMQTRSWMPPILTVAAILLFVGYIAVLLYIPIPRDVRDIIITLGGVTPLLLREAWHFYMGTTGDSQDKTKTISDIAKMP